MEESPPSEAGSGSPETAVPSDRGTVPERTRVERSVPERVARGPHPGTVLLDVPVRLSVQLGAAQLSLREVRGLTPGSVVELDRSAHDPVDILVNDRLIAHGEVVLVDENFGVRVLDIVTGVKSEMPTAGPYTLNFEL